jgi:cytoskeleton protein RodZ
VSGQIVPLCVNSDAASAGTDPLPTSVGEQLRAARTSQGLSTADVAKKLKLSPHQVESLEADDWSRLPCNTIIRGFVRNYARLLGLDSNALMGMLDRLQMPLAPELEISAGTNVRVPQEGTVERRDYLRVFSGLAVLGLAVLAYFFFPQAWLQSTVAAFKAMTQGATVSEVVPAPASVPEAAVLPPADSAVPASEPAMPAQPAINPITMPPASAPADAAPRHSLKFVFGQPSWVEVRDRSGQIIFSQLSQAGSQREIEGQPPFALVIGNASHVTLQYRGKEVDLSRRSKEDVARVTVE